MKIILAGYNLDSEVIEGLKRGEKERIDITPEVLSASYARISRDPRPINELRAAARKEVEKARRSNQNIIFKMGHHSVAEHAVFNFDIIGVSRLAFEEIEKFRLCSYTEKSQRYQKLEASRFIPDEIANSEFKGLFNDVIGEQNSLYALMVKNGTEPEDARYITSLATPGQAGMTLNARNLELVFRRFASSPLAEIQQIGREMFDQVKTIAPSIILFTEATPLDRDTYSEIRKIIKKPGPKGNIREVELVEHTKEADRKLIASLMHTLSLSSYKDCLAAVRSLNRKKKEAIIKTALKNLEFYDSTLREFEYPELTFDLVVSAACFGQLKRHRIATLTCQAYDPGLGLTIPPSVIRSGMEKDFRKTAEASGKAFAAIIKKLPPAAPYILTNAHRRRVLFKCNARELYHISRLREDKHAQWDIQNITRQMSGKAISAMPLTFLTLCGKDIYPEVYQSVFGIKPRISPLAG